METFSDHQQLRDWLSLNNAIEAEGGQVPCRQAPDLFFPEKIGIGAGFDGSHLKMAVKACQACPVMKKCGDYAIKLFHYRAGLASLDCQLEVTAVKA